jgi:hypothetical protein
LEVFLLANDQRIWHIRETIPGRIWFLWETLHEPQAQVTNGAPFVGMNADGRLEIFATGADGGIYHAWQTAPDSGWSGWQSLQPALPGVKFFGLGAVTNNHDGRFQLFFIGTDGALWTLAQSAPSNGWQTVRFLDNPALPDPLNADQRPAAVLDTSGILHVFVANPSGLIFQVAQVSPGGTWGQLATAS